MLKLQKDGKWKKSVVQVMAVAIVSVSERGEKLMELLLYSIV